MGKLTSALIASALGCLVVGSAAPAEAQVVPKPPPKVFRPARPTFSPYLELTRPQATSPGRLPQYYTFYQRDLQYQQDYQRQVEINRQAQASLTRLQSSINALSAQPPTGSNAAFGTSSNYYGTHSGYFRLGAQ